MTCINCEFFNVATYIGSNPGGVLPYLGYTGTCHWTGYGFCPPCPKQGKQFDLPLSQTGLKPVLNRVWYASSLFLFFACDLDPARS